MITTRPEITPVHRLVVSLVLLLAVVLPVRAAGEPAWQEVRGGAVRLIAGTPDLDGTRRAGLQFRLDQGWKTYWRAPGDSGVPPTFDWSASRNLAGVEVAMPAPGRFDDEGGVTIGYADAVTWPLTVRATDPSQPVRLALSLDFAVCGKICIPTHAKLTLDLPPGTSAPPDHDKALAQARDAVPVVEALGAASPLSVLAVDSRAGTAPPQFIVRTRSAGKAALFVEGPGDWYLPVPGPGPEPGSFILDLKGAPKGAVLSGTTLRLTLTEGGHGTETSWTIP